MNLFGEPDSRVEYRQGEMFGAGNLAQQEAAARETVARLFREVEAGRA